ncbi:helix-turn-helix domain-containing protein [Paenibacillus radicis (ex Xue et al. 2023)]|uniref:Helix-turn-helix transcriptional regulator n=1 Tax=Paenibacillus radicis (ex Xue et al. 2023) TaxID=2972489 RepID=A0ABT1YN33_9BACL|nr:helix-turn-helix transcriptional regulator [Paenibacillus radicis (ex Xue et al. 2023)]MCR8634578.1 helix-turn-helix transcriptional regulator [Paenibacillus radicis (ex Xue et al. 2023)]
MISYNPLLKVIEQDGVTFKELIESHGFSSRTLAKIRKGESVTLETIERLCFILKIPIQNVVEILDENGEKFKR